MSVSYIFQLHRFVSVVLNTAFKEGIIPRNYASCATPPKPEKVPVVALKEDEIATFFTVLYTKSENYMYQVFFTLLLATGCRVGELCALSWDKIDLDEGKIHVCQHYVTDDTGRHVKTGCKTLAGDRWLYLDDGMLKILTEYRDFCDERIDKYGTKWNSEMNAVFRQIYDQASTSIRTQFVHGFGTF